MCLRPTVWVRFSFHCITINHSIVRVSASTAKGASFDSQPSVAPVYEKHFEKYFKLPHPAALQHELKDEAPI